MPRKYTPRIECTCEFCGSSFYVVPSRLKRGGRYCSRLCTTEGRKASAKTRFWSFVCRDSDGCWGWQRYTDDRGYGRFKFNLIYRTAHSVAYELTYGPIPDGMFVCHHCDNPSCCRPDHLFLGTPAQNSQDMVAKGRQAKGEQTSAYKYPERRATGERNGSKTKPERVRKGSQHGMARLTEADVIAIRMSVGVPQKVLAERYGVYQQTISRIINRLNWKHIP